MEIVFLAAASFPAPKAPCRRVSLLGAAWASNARCGTGNGSASPGAQGKARLTATTPASPAHRTNPRALMVFSSLGAVEERETGKPVEDRTVMEISMCRLGWSENKFGGLESAEFRKNGFWSSVPLVNRSPAAAAGDIDVVKIGNPRLVRISFPSARSGIRARSRPSTAHSSSCCAGPGCGPLCGNKLSGPPGSRAPRRRSCRPRLAAAPLRWQ